jgi:hypothetical protein
MRAAGLAAVLGSTTDLSNWNMEKGSGNILSDDMIHKRITQVRTLFKYQYNQHKALNMNGKGRKTLPDLQQRRCQQLQSHESKLQTMKTLQVSSNASHPPLHISWNSGRTAATPTQRKCN